MDYDVQNMSDDEKREVGLKEFVVKNGTYSRMEKGGLKIYQKGEKLWSTKFSLKGIHNVDQLDTEPEVIADLVKNSLKAVRIGGGWYDVINEVSGKKINTKALREKDAKALVDNWELEDEEPEVSEDTEQQEKEEEKEVGCSYPENKTTKWVFGTDFDDTIDCDECMVKHLEEYTTCEIEHDKKRKVEPETEETEVQTETEEDRAETETEDN